MTSDEYKTAANFWKTKERKEMPVEELKSVVEEFLRSSAVCALATGTGDYVRCTPLEYSFRGGQFWIFTGGGTSEAGRSGATDAFALHYANENGYSVF